MQATWPLSKEGAFGADWAAGWARPVLYPLQAMMSSPGLVFLAALTAMLLRHPDVSFYEIDRVAFIVLVLAVIGRAVILRQRLIVLERISWPMFGLTLLAVASVAGRPFDNQTWCLLAAKYIVPFALFHMARLIFEDERQFRQLELFSLFVLAYLSFTAIAFLLGAKSLIYPQFILDESLGHHADRARGPLLQAVANGVSLIMLGLLVLHAFRRRSLRGWKVVAVLASLPLAILATMTRAVWITFAAAVVWLIFHSESRKLRRACLWLVLMSGVGLAVILTSTDLGCALVDRMEERGPVDYRQEMYAGSWEMFRERPLSGWGFNRMPAELPLHVSGYAEKELYPHNTYLELLVEQGVAGLLLYVWMMWELWRLARGGIPRGEGRGFLNPEFHQLWPVLLAVYWVNAAMVVMSYQFVNGLLFSLAGMLAAQRRRAEAPQSC